MTFQARALRLLGEHEKAIALWKDTIARSWATAVIDLSEFLVAEGRTDEAKAVAQAAAQEADMGKNPTVLAMRDFTAAIGNPAPSFEKAINVGRGEFAQGKTTLFFGFHLQMAVVDQKLNALDSARTAAGEKTQVAGVATFRHYNPETMKVEEAMTPEAEREWYKLFLQKFGVLVPCVLVEKDVLDGLMLKLEPQMVIVDAEGKLRWMRIGKDDQSYYDRWSAELALKKIAGA
jgi:hypothetical protein